MPPKSRRESTVIRPGSGPRRNCWPSRSHVRPTSPPGTDFEYSNTNYALLGLIIERVDGRPLARSMQDRFFGPLGMKNTRTSRQYREHDPRTVLARLSLRQLIGRLGGDAAVLARAQSRGPGRDAPAQRLHGPEPFHCRGGRGRHLHRQRSRHLDPGAGRRPRAQRRVSAPLARQPAARGPEQARRPAVRVRHQPTAAGDRTRSIFTAARRPGTTRKSATTPPTG